MTRYRVACTGYGARGKQHIHAFERNADRFEIVAVCDLDPAKREQARADLGDAVRTYESTEAMLELERPDVFCFCTMPEVRLELVELAARCGVRGVAYEKPIALSLQEARIMRDRFREHGIKAVVSHQMKYGEHFRAVKELAVSGALGRLHTIHATAKGWWLQYATHLLDYMMFFNGVVGAEWVCGHANGTRLLRDTHPSPEYVMGTIRFVNGVRGIVEAGLLAPEVPGEENFWFTSRIALYGERGMAEVRVGRGWSALHADSGGPIGGDGCWDAARDQPPYIRDFADWLDDDARVHPCNNEDACTGFEIACALVESALTCRRIDLPFEPQGDLVTRLRTSLPQQPDGGTWLWG